MLSYFVAFEDKHSVDLMHFDESIMDELPMNRHSYRDLNEQIKIKNILCKFLKRKKKWPFYDVECKKDVLSILNGSRPRRGQGYSSSVWDMSVCPNSASGYFLLSLSKSLLSSHFFFFVTDFNDSLFLTISLLSH